jgi:hypothetical protein
MASASVSLNTSVLYIGQAVGSAIGGVLYGRELLHASGYVAETSTAREAPGSSTRDICPRVLRSGCGYPARLEVCFALHRRAKTQGKWEVI